MAQRRNTTAQLWECTNEDYHADASYVGRSQFLDFVKSPALYESRYLTGTSEPRKTNAGMQLGSVFEAMVGDGSFRVTAQTFVNKTIAVWKSVKSVPKAASPLSYSLGSGQFWATSEGVYRKAKDWGALNDGCTWTLDVDPPRGKQATGFCRFADFLPTTHFTPIPPHVLNDKGERKGLPWERFAAKRPGELLLKANEYAGLPVMLERLRECEGARFIAEASRHDQSQNTIVWVDEQTGVPRKCRIDLWPTDERMNWIADLKTTSTEDLRAFAWSVIDFGYDVQAEWYCDGVEALTGKRPEFVFVVVNTQDKHGYWVETLKLDEDYRRRARRIIDRGLAAMAACRESGVWRKPAHNKVLTLPMPPAAKNDESWQIELELEVN